MRVEHQIWCSTLKIELTEGWTAPWWPTGYDATPRPRLLPYRTMNIE
jgi:hypothetical protein